MVNPGYAVLKQISAWPAINRDGLQKWVSTNLRYKDLKEAEGQCELFNSQHIVKDFLQHDSPYRSLLLFHGLGTGKTRTSIAVAETLSSDYKIAVMLPASLETNYITEIISCGNEEYVKTGKWTKSNSPADIAKVLKEGGAPKVAKKNGGVWIKTATGTPFESLQPDYQNEITSQIYSQIAKRYSFIHYNGLQGVNKIKELLDAHDGFRNYVVIIDEVHNFISKIVNNSPILTKLYNALLTQSDCKILMLSGTPIINKPIEVGKIANLARGELDTIVFNIPPNQFRENIKRMLDKDPAIDYYDINPIAGRVSVVPLPKYFTRDRNNFLIKNPEANPGVAGITVRLEGAFENMGIQKVKGTLLKSRLFPDDEIKFNELFVDYKTTSVKNPILFTRRIQGLVSYYATYDRKDFPELYNTQYVKLPLSNTAFKHYMDFRQTEIAAEDRANKKQGFDVTTSTYYRFLSRAVSNFAFPGEKRPLPSTMKHMQKEMGEIPDVNEFDKMTGNIDTEITKGRKSKTRVVNTYEEYKDLLEKEKRKLKRTGALLPENLEEYSPKFKAIIDKVNSNDGSALVYSSFRNVEGLGILKLALEAHGYAYLDVKEDPEKKEWYIDTKDWNKPHFIEFSSESKERTTLLLNLFNNAFDKLPKSIVKQLRSNEIQLTNLNGELIKLIMITQSGAEGISLRNVRTVHIMEPYWNDVRIKQVIGRAVRAKSHLDLPENKRNVQVFMYLSVFSEEQLNADLVINRENRITSDEHILSVANKKSKLTDGFLNILKSASIDCRIHKRPTDSHNCITLPTGLKIRNQPILYDAIDATVDLPNTKITPQIKKRTIARKLGRIQKKGEEIVYYFDKSTLELLHPETMMVIGVVDMSFPSKPDVVFFEP